MAVAGKAGRVCWHKRDSIEFHWPSCPPPRGQPPVEGQTGWLVGKSVPIARRCRAIQIQADPHAIIAAGLLPGDLG